MRPTRPIAPVLALLAACAARTATPPPAPGAAAPASPEAVRERLDRAALELGLPLFWTDDANGNGAIDPGELAVVWGLDPRPRAHWVQDGRFTPAFAEAWAQVQARAGASPGVPQGPDAARQAALSRELAQSTFTVIASDFTGAPAEDRAFVGHVLEAARSIERLYQRQLGTLGMETRIPPADGLSRLVFFLNQAPWCSAPATEKDPGCSALSPAPPRLSGLYPADLQADKGFCSTLASDPRREALTSPFTVVTRDASGALSAVPYAEAYRDDMRAVSRELEAAAAAIASPGEAALRAYLSAAARAFQDGDWLPADEAWARMSALDSRWFLRVAPDEVYYEPCSLKAGFHLSFARIDRRSLAWQERLEPVKGDMERAIAAMAGPPYAARAVSFHLPDFIDVILNAGESRQARGATVGQSLPNWGKVATEGRGRTVAMVNLYDDPENRRVQRRRAESLLCAATLSSYSEGMDEEVLGTVLHEAAHNLGPASEYRVAGRGPEQIFGGPLAATLEELKAQTSALHLTGWLAERGVIDRGLADRSRVRGLVWALGQISRGTYDAQGKVKPYGALASIQVGSLLEQGALRWRAGEVAANGSDRGCLEIDFARLPGAVAKLETAVLGIKARGDVAAANALAGPFLDPKAGYADVVRSITERWRRFPTATFLYSVRL
jgi:hypothetical protein